MLPGHLSAKTSGGQTSLIKIGRPRNEKGVGDAVAANTVIMGSQRKLIKIDANLTDGKLENDRVALQCKDADWWVDATGQ